ncbi:hypothetical protein BHE74_00039078 [Ensete ventricosum]|nr:hypothetical protein BHE74_00039078 [Ensete ventricosum]
MYDEEASNKQLHENLDLLEEKQAESHLRTLAYKKVVDKLYNRRVQPQSIRSGDLVLRKIEVSDPTRSHGKLAANWESPCRIMDVMREGTCTLPTMEGRLLPRTWHISNIQKFYT